MLTALVARRRQRRRVIRYGEDEVGQVASHEAMRVLLVSTLLSATCFGQGLEGTSGIWKMNAARSTFAGGSAFKSLRSDRASPQRRGVHAGPHRDRRPDHYFQHDSLLRW